MFAITTPSSSLYANPRTRWSFVCYVTRTTKLNRFDETGVWKPKQ
jgi:hypothetical protein